MWKKLGPDSMTGLFLTFRLLIEVWLRYSWLEYFWSEVTELRREVRAESCLVL